MAQRHSPRSGSHVQTSSRFLPQNLHQANIPLRPLRGADRGRRSHSSGHGLRHCMRAFPVPGACHRHCGRVPHFPVQRQQVPDRRPHRRLCDHHYGRAGTVSRLRPADLHLDGGRLSHHLRRLPHGGAHPLHPLPRHHGIYLRHCRGDLLHTDQGHLRPHHCRENSR